MSDDLKKAISALKTKISETRINLDAKRAEVDRAQKQVRDLISQGATLERQFHRDEADMRALEAKADAANKPLRVSDHAVVRYLERKLGLNLDTIRAEILTPSLVDNMVRLGDGTYGNAVVKDRTVVTFLE